MEGVEVLEQDLEPRRVACVSSVVARLSVLLGGKPSSGETDARWPCPAGGVDLIQVPSTSEAVRSTRRYCAGYETSLDGSDWDFKEGRL